MSAMARVLTIAALALLCAPAARADIAVLANGQTMKIASVRQDEGRVWLGLKEGGEIALPAAEQGSAAARARRRRHQAAVHPWLARGSGSCRDRGHR